MAVYASVIPLQGPCGDNDSHQFPLIHTGQGVREPAAAKHTQSLLSRCYYCGSGCVGVGVGMCERERLGVTWLGDFMCICHYPWLCKPWYYVWVNLCSCAKGETVSKWYIRNIYSSMGPENTEILFYRGKEHTHIFKKNNVMVFIVTRRLFCLQFYIKVLL